MKLTFLGTGAAEGVPSPFCTCGTCEYARANKGRNIRRRQSVIVNDDMLIDFGPDIFASCADQGLSLAKVEYLLITHSHSDHFDPSALVLREKGYRLANELPRLTMVAGPSVWAKWDACGSDRTAEIRRVPTLPGRTLELPPYKVRTIAATHDLVTGDAMNYIITDGGTTLLYASDSGMYTESVWEELKGERFDIVVLEGTIWRQLSWTQHLNRGDFGLMLERMREIGAITDRTAIVATHFSHQSTDPHEQLEAEVKQFGARCAYDGYVIEV